MKVDEKSKAVKAEIEDDAAVLDSAVFVVCVQDLRVFPVLCMEADPPFPLNIRGLCKDEEELMQAKDGKRSERDHREGAGSKTN